MTTLSERLRAAGIDVRFRWEDAQQRTPIIHTVARFRGGKLVMERVVGPPPSSTSDDGHLKRLGLRVRAERQMEIRRRKDRLGFWLDGVPNDPEMHALIDDILNSARDAFIDWRKKLNDPRAYYVLLDGARHPKLFNRLRELRWKRADEGARRRGAQLPHLLQGDRFSIHGYNFEVTGVGHDSLRISLLDEGGSRIAGCELFGDVPCSAPVEVSKPLPKEARARMYLALQLVDELESHLAGKLDPE